MVNCLLQLIGTCLNCARTMESKLDRATGGGGGGGGGWGCGILLNRLITAGSGGIAPLNSGPAARVFMLSLVKFSG